MISFFRNMPLQWKLAASTSLVLALATAGVLLYFPANQRAALQEGIEARAKTTTDMIAYSVAPAVNIYLMQSALELPGAPEGEATESPETPTEEAADPPGALAQPEQTLQQGVEEIFQGASKDEDLLAIRIEDPDGKRLAQWQPKNKNQSIISVDQIIDTSLTPKEGAENEEAETSVAFGEEVLNAAKIIEYDGKPLGVLRVAYSLEPFNQKVSSIWLWASVMGAVIFFLGTVLAYLIGLPIAAPLRWMTSTFKKMSEGDLTQDPLSVRSSDEIGLLAGAYNDLLHQLRALSEHAGHISQGDLTRPISEKGDLADAFRAMAATFTEIARRFDELSGTLDERTTIILTTTKQQEAGAAEQASTVSEVTATMGELAATARQIAGNAESVTESAEQSAEAVAEGRTSLSAFVQSISAIENGNQTINDNIIQLNRHVQQIGGIIDLINDIADRSDLLALNAALEGTKAGEAGKGFLLVAGEMRRLAENVFNSTAEIKQLIAEVTEATNATVMATESGMKATRKGVSLAQNAEKAFDRIVQTIEETTQASKQISVATQQQHTGTDQIVSAMSEVSDVAQQSLDGIRQTAHSVSDLSNMASMLRKMIAGFKVSKEE